MPSEMSGVSVRNSTNPNRFAYLEIMPTIVGGKPTYRLMATFKTVGCGYGKCSHCELGENAFEGITTEHLKKQMNSIFAEIKKRGIPIEKIGLVDLLTNGSFLDPGEVPPEARMSIIKSTAEGFPNCRKLVIDTRPEYVSKAVVQPLVRELERHGKNLEVSIGIDTIGFLNRKIVNKGYGFRALARAFKELKEAGSHVMGYVLVKPPGQNEFEAINVATRAARKVLEIGNRLYPDNPHAVTVSLEPVFVGGRTPLKRLQEEGRYEPAHLFSVAEIVRRVKEAFPKNDIYVGLSSEGIAGASAREANNRTREGIDTASTKRTKKLFARFNHTQDMGGVREILNDPSQSRKFWQDTVSRESRLWKIKRVATRLRILRDVRRYQDSNKQFEFTQAGSRACARPRASARVA